MTTSLQPISNSATTATQNCAITSSGFKARFPGYGYRRLGRQLRREGIVVNNKKIRRLQRQYQLFPLRWHSFKISTPDSYHAHKVYPNLLAKKTLTGINQAWVADIT